MVEGAFHLVLIERNVVLGGGGKGGAGGGDGSVK